MKKVTFDNNLKKFIKSYSSEKGSKTESFIVSKKNSESDIVDMNLFFKKEKKVRDQIKICNLKKKSFIGTFHSIILHENYNNLNITDIKPTIAKISKTQNYIPFSNESKTVKHQSENEISLKGSNDLRQLKKKNKMVNGMLYSFELDKMLKKKNPMLAQVYVSKEKISTLVEKSKSVFFSHYALNLKTEEVVRINENSQNSIDAYRDCISSSLKINDYIDKELFIQMDLLNKFLGLQKKTEKDKLNDCLESKKKLESEIKQLEYKIGKQKFNLKQNKDYRNFLICVKERKVKTDLVDLLKNEGFLEEQRLLINPFLKNIHSTFKLNRQKSINIDHIIKKAEEKVVFDTYFENKFNGNSRIYMNSSELLNDLKKLEVQNLNLLEESNRNEILLGKIEQKWSFSFQDKDSDGYFYKTIKNGHSTISNLKRFNKDLKTRSLSKIDEYKSNFHNLNYLNNNRIFFKIKEIFKTCIIFSSNDKLMEKKLNQSVNLTSIDNSEIKNEYLKTIENVLRHMQSKYIKYIKENPNDLINIEKQLEIQKKEQNARDQRLADKEKFEKLKKKIIERLQKNYILPKKRVMFRYPPRKIKKRSFSLNKVEKDDELQELLTYDSEF